ncbi:biotin-dependent carboxyltransferase family protein [Christiangramia sabulilitoris]|nr:biotin-dependent carboxyltransferase family protein [Christiangramia sabulilitoris]
MAEIEVIQPGLFSSIQDLGRFGYQKFGVPQSGVMDRYAMRICNMILGNSQDTAVMEITMQGPELKFSASAYIYMCGADISPKLNSEVVPQKEIITIKPGDILKFGRLKRGFRAYLGIRGGFNTQEVLGSKSWYEGLTDEFRLKKGMLLEYDHSNFKDANTFSSLKIEMDYLESQNIEAYPGPEFEKLSPKQKEELFDTEFTLDQSSNRMAVQFNQELYNDLEPIITAPVVPGTVQLTPSGKLIALMRDCQTTGGYPRILQLSENGIQTISQKIPGEMIRFRKKEYPHFHK